MQTHTCKHIETYMQNIKIYMQQTQIYIQTHSGLYENVLRHICAHIHSHRMYPYSPSTHTPVGETYRFCLGLSHTTPLAVRRGVAGNEVGYVFSLRCLKLKHPLLFGCLHLHVQNEHIVHCIHSHALQFLVRVVGKDLLRVPAHELHSVDIHGQEDPVGVGPEPLVLHGEEGAPVEWIVLH